MPHGPGAPAGGDSGDEAASVLDRVVAEDDAAGAGAVHRGEHVDDGEGREEGGSVLTMFDKDWQYLNQTLQVNDNICVAGGVTTKGDWMTKRFQDVAIHTNGRARVHGLGYVTFPKMFQVPLVSVDSSSWKQAAICYGCLPYFTAKGMKGIPLRKILTKGGRCIPKDLREELNNIKVTPSMLANKELHKGNFLIQSLIACVAYIKFQRYARRHGRQLFLAVSQKSDIQRLNYVYNNFNDLDYEQYRKMSNNG